MMTSDVNIIKRITGSLPPFRVGGRLIVLCLVLIALTGCSLIRFHPSQPQAKVKASQLSTNLSESVTPIILQAQVMRLADTYVATVSQACDDLAASTKNPDLRLFAVRWKLSQATSAYTDAAGQNPGVNALDLLVLVTMARLVIEEHAVEAYGDAVLPLLNVQQNLETNAWKIAAAVLKPSQQIELRNMIKAWRLKNPHQRYVGPIRFREFVAALGQESERAKSAPASIFSLLYLDPLAGLDPTAAAIQETREMGERAIYYTERMPQLLSWQVELLSYELAGQPESRQVLSDAQQLASAAEIFAKTSEQLPKLVNDQRQAAIQQIFDNLSAEGGKSEALLTNTHATLDSASEAAKNINAALQSLTAFVRYVSPTNSGTVTTTNSQPFNILDYGTTASQIGSAVSNLNSLLITINQSTPQLAQLGQQTTEASNRVVDRAFRLALILIVILLVGSVLAGLTYRILANKFSPRK